MTGHPDRRPAVVTGASSGIGQATAELLAASGYPVVLGARRAERCEETATAIRAAGGEAVAVRLDVTDDDSVGAFVKSAQAAMGDIEVLVSNAGDASLSTAASTHPEEFAAQLQVNLIGAQRLVSALAPAMVERGRGDLVFVTSDVVRAPRPGMATYVSAKWGLEGLARAMQMELEGTGVRASIVRPGPTITEMGFSWDEEPLFKALDQWKHWGLMRHDGYLRPEGVAAAILAVVSAPRGTHFTLLEVEPEAPAPEDKGERPR